CPPPALPGRLLRPGVAVYGTLLHPRPHGSPGRRRGDAAGTATDRDDSVVRLLGQPDQSPDPGHLPVRGPFPVPGLPLSLPARDTRSTHQPPRGPAVVAGLLPAGKNSASLHPSSRCHPKGVSDARQLSFLPPPGHWRG